VDCSTIHKQLVRLLYAQKPASKYFEQLLEQVVLFIVTRMSFSDLLVLRSAYIHESEHLAHGRAVRFLRYML
jgi:hypothetical protein